MPTHFDKFRLLNCYGGRIRNESDKPIQIGVQDGGMFFELLPGEEEELPSPTGETIVKVPQSE
jgi:hypothetical protein